MDKHSAAKFLPLIAALAEGKTIQVKLSHWSTWADIRDPIFDGNPEEYRVKPEAKWCIIAANAIGTHFLYSWGGVTVFCEEEARLVSQRIPNEYKLVQLVKLEE